jgi:hypothetical protein
MMTKKSTETLIAEKIAWLRKQCTAIVNERTFTAAECGGPIEAETGAFREVAAALFAVERYMLPDIEAKPKK